MQSNTTRKIILLIGYLLLLSILVINQYIIECYFSYDGKIDSTDKLFIIWIYDIFAVIISVVIIYKRGAIKITLKGVIIIFIEIIYCLILLEVALHLYFVLIHINGKAVMTFDEQIGWVTEPGISEIYNSDLYGTVKYSTQKYGFRKFGDINSKKTKVLVIGDSFTMAACITDGNTYYDYLLKNNSNIEIFAYGGGGYGTIQEYLILDKYIDEIRPDIILWQFCDNDMINNDHELESKSTRNGGLDPRPFYINNKIEVLKPWRRHNKTYDFLHELYLVKLLSLELLILEEDHLISIENSLTKDNPLFLNAVNATNQIMTLCKERIGKIPIISFNAKMYADFPDWWSKVFMDIANNNNFVFLLEITDSLTYARELGIRIDEMPQDEHWNSTGHKIVGKVLLDYLLNNQLIDPNN